MRQIDFDSFQLRADSPPIHLLFGSDDALVDACARAVVAAIKSSAADAELDERSAAAVIDDPALLFDAAKAVSLFGGTTILLVTGVTERLAPALLSFFEDDFSGATTAIVLTTMALKSKSKVIEAAKRSAVVQPVACYEAAASRNALRDALGDVAITPDGLEALQRAATALDPLRRRQLTEKLTLYAAPDAALSGDDVEACAEDGAAAGDRLAEILLTGDPAALLAELAGLRSLGKDDSALVATLSWTINDLAAGAAQMAGQGGRRPFWKTERILKTASQRLSRLSARLETASREMHELERRLRSQSPTPSLDIERAALRLSRAFS